VVRTGLARISSIRMTSAKPPVPKSVPMNFGRSSGSISRKGPEELRRTRSNSVDGDILQRTDEEVYEPMQIAYQLKTASGTATYSASDSSLSVDGYRGEKLR